jgi:hypothetical protein
LVPFIAVVAHVLRLLFSGQVAKICNNLVLGISMSAVSEAMNLGVKLGIDPKTLAAIINTWVGSQMLPIHLVRDAAPFAGRPVVVGARILTIPALASWR